MRSEVIDLSAPYAINRQVTLRVAGGGERCWALRSTLAEKLQAAPIMVKDRAVYVAVESSPEMRAKNR
eukprot:11157994-Heterocapsa_arctica.AAC.1